MIVIGCLALLPALGILISGGALAIAQAAATDDDGYFRFTLDRVESDGVAVASTPLSFDDVDDEAGPWVLDWLDLDLRLRVDGALTTDDVFVGIARSDEVDRYLANTEHTEIVEIDHHTPRYREVTGLDRAAPPLDQTFWAASTSGPGEQELTWNARGGRWSVVVMNADGSPNVAADIEIGARSDVVTPVAITLLVAGAIGTAIAVTLIVVGARGRRRPGTRPHGLPATGSPLPPPTSDTAVLQDDQDREPTTVA
jgi:hypothetical protein